MAWFFVQIRANYYAKVSVLEAARYAEQLTEQVGAYERDHGSFPSSLSDLSLPAGEPGYVPGVTLDRNTGALVIDVKSGDRKLGVLRFIQKSVAGERGHWHCENVSVSKELLPAQCTI